MAAKEGNNKFFSERVLLKPEEVGFLELFRILFPREKEKSKFVDCEKGAKPTFERRWIVFISILVQKLLLSVSKPLAWVGSKIETGLNLPSSNGGTARLFLNCCRGTDPIFDPFSYQMLINLT